MAGLGHLAALAFDDGGTKAVFEKIDRLDLRARIVELHSARQVHATQQRIHNGQIPLAQTAQKLIT